MRILMKLYRLWLRAFWSAERRVYPVLLDVLAWLVDRFGDRPALERVYLLLLTRWSTATFGPLVLDEMPSGPVPQIRAEVGRLRPGVAEHGVIRETDIDWED